MSTVDCSRYQGVLSVAMLQQWKAAGVTRVILKAGGGDSGRYEDSKWATNSANVVAAGLILEAYWFNGTTDPAGDAQFLLGFLPARVRVWADVEPEGTMPHWSDGQADAFERPLIAAGHPTGTYMSQSVTFGSWPLCGKRPLWVADYGPNSVPGVGPDWSAPVLWQYTSTGHLPGYAGNLDLDQDLAGIDTAGATATPIPNGDEDMAAKYQIVKAAPPSQSIYFVHPAGIAPIHSVDPELTVLQSFADQMNAGNPPVLTDAQYKLVDQVIQRRL